MNFIKEVYGRLNKVAFYICLFTSIFLIVTAFFLPPVAVIEASVLAATGELFAFAALGTVITAIDKGVDAKVKHGDTELHIINDEENNNNDTAE
jgi:hypothetical protein